MSNEKDFYLGNQKLKKVGVPQNFTSEQIKEFVKCSNNVNYFIKKYIKIVHVDKGLVNFKLWPFQENMVKTIVNNRFTICKLPRQVGKCYSYKTRINIRDNTTGIEYETTIGEFYDRIKQREIETCDEKKQSQEIRNEICQQKDTGGIYSVSNMPITGSGFSKTHKISSSGNKHSRLSEEQFNTLYELHKETINTLAERKQPWVQSSGKNESNEKFGYKRENNRKNIQISNKKWENTSDIKLLVEENRWRYRKSKITSCGISEQFFTREVYNETWGNYGKENMGRTPTQMARNHAFENTRRKNDHPQEKIDGFNFEFGKNYFSRIEKNNTRITDSIWYSKKWEMGNLRLQVPRQTYRIPGELLALKSENIQKRFLQQDIKENSTRNLDSRSKENSISYRKQLSNNRNMGIRLHEKSKTNNTIYDKLSNTVERKFIESYDIENFDVLSDTGYVPITQLHKTIPYEEWIVTTETKQLICADKHILFDEHYNEIFCEDLNIGDYIITKNGKEKVLSIERTYNEENMFDLSVDSNNHRYYTNGILSHNTTTVAAVILWYVLFHENYSVALLAHKLLQSREILGRIQLAYENLPKWMQQGVSEWNKGNVLLENGSKILAAATSSSAIRGGTFNMIYLDEFAFVPPHIQGDFFASVYPTISSGETTKVIITSTPKGLNIFYKLWTEAEQGKNSFIPFQVHWSDVPGRDQKWKEETIKNTSEQQFREEFETEFVGSTNTLINPSKLLSLAAVRPIRSDHNYHVYEDPTLPENKKNLYVLVADTARGVGQDYSAFVVYNVTKMPYKIAATYYDNEISPLIYPNVIHQFARMYNNAYTCIEVNDNGQQIADILFRELEYENIVFSSMKGRVGQVISSGFASNPTPGIRTTKQLKRIGCTNLKSLVENDKLIIEDINVINELYTFIEDGESFEAEAGSHDDLVMCCVIFSWLVMQPYFKEWTETNVRESMYLENLKLIEEDLLPFSIMDNGHNIITEIDTDISTARMLTGNAFERWLLANDD